MEKLDKELLTPKILGKLLNLNIVQVFDQIPEYSSQAFKDACRIGDINFTIEESKDNYYTVGVNKDTLVRAGKELAWANGYALNTEMITCHISKKLAYRVSIEPTEYMKFSKTSETECEAILAMVQYMLENGKLNKNKDEKLE